MESTMKMALAWLLTYAIHSTALLAFAFAVSRWTRLSTHTLDFIWKLALVGGLATSVAQFALDVRPIGSFALQAPLSTAQSIDASPTSNAAPAATVVHAAESEHDPIASNAGTAPAASATTPAFAFSRTTIERILVIGWALVALILALSYTARRLMLVGRLANRQHITDGALPAILDALCRAVGFRSHVALTSVNTISSPVALGLHEICVPDAVLTELTPDEQRGLLAHELAHLARRDPVWLDVASLMERVFFFQPLNRLARRELQRNAEFLCDDWAAERTGTGLPLAHCLAHVAEWIEARPLGVPVAGMAEQRSLLVTRIARLIEGKRTSSPLSRALTIGTASLLLSAVVAAAPSVSGVALAPQSPPTSSTPTNDRTVDPIEPRVADGASRQSGAGVSNAQAVRDAVAAERARIRAERGGASQHANAASNAPQPEDPAVIAALIERLRDTDAGVRRAAASSLGSLKSRTAVPALIAAIGDKNKDVRLAVCEALGDIGDERAVPALSRMLNDEVPDVRSHALEALSEFAEQLSASQITPSTQDARADTRAKAAELLGEIGDRQSISVLQRLVTDQSADVRRQAIESLGKFNDSSVGAALLPAIRDPVADVREAAIDALCELKVVIPARDIATLLADASPDVRSRALEYVKEQPALANVALIRPMLDDTDENVRESAVDALAELRSPEARAALRTALNSTDPRVRRRAAEALGERR